MKKTVIGITAMVGLLLAAQASASTIGSSVSGSDGPIVIQLQGSAQESNTYLGTTPMYSNGNAFESWGIFHITSITQGGASVWTNFDTTTNTYNPTQYYGTYYGLYDYLNLPGQPNDKVFIAQGASTAPAPTTPPMLIPAGFSIYETPYNAALSAIVATPADKLSSNALDASRVGYDGYAGMTGPVAFKGLFDPGAFGANGVVDPAILMTQIVTQAQLPATGTGEAYGSLIDTTTLYYSLLNSNTIFDRFGGAHDIRLQFTITNFRISDPADLNAVPEPATMLLFGAGLAGLAGIRRRRSN